MWYANFITEMKKSIYTAKLCVQLYALLNLALLHILSALPLYALDRGWVSPIGGLGMVMNTKSFLWQGLNLGCWAHS